MATKKKAVSPRKKPEPPKPPPKSRPEPEGLVSFTKAMDAAKKYLLKNKLWDVPITGASAFKWDLYIKLVLDGFVLAPVMKRAFGSPLAALVAMTKEGLKRELAKPTDKPMEDDRVRDYLRKMIERTEDSLKYRNIYVDGKAEKPGITKKMMAEAAGILRKRGLLK